MDKLTEARERINRADEEIAKLWAERMEAVREIGEYKKANSLPIFDASRETSLLEKNLSYVPDALSLYYKEFQRGVIETSKHYQRELFESDDTLSVNLGERSYDILIRRGALLHASEFIDLKRKVMIVTDDGVPAEYAKAIAGQCLEAHIVTLPQGEQTKCFESYRLLLNKMLELEFTRKDCVAAVGGGVIGDLSGFAAASYMRGIDFYNIPTTTLSQIDSSIGGKVAIDLDGYKNTVGAFWQPRFVLIDPDVLDTLDQRQISAGLAEAVKMALCFDEGLFELFEAEDAYKNIDEIITRSLKIKKKVVEEDEKESGLRKVLNFGHTIGHGIETSAHGKLLHGECVALGMLPMCSESVRERLINVLKILKLPTVIPNDNTDEIKRALRHDKKGESAGITVVKVMTAGKYSLEKISFTELDDIFDRYLQVSER